MGTDTLAGILLVKRFYLEKGMPGYSIPAAEHSTITSWGREREIDAFRNMLTSYPTGLVAVVSDRCAHGLCIWWAPHALRIE
jgi:nicotinamide phosphoribosyltransferase